MSKGADVTTSNHAGETVASVVEAKRLSCFLPEEKAALEKIAAACKTTVGVPVTTLTVACARADDLALGHMKT